MMARMKESPRVRGTNRKWYSAVNANCRRESSTGSSSLMAWGSGLDDGRIAQDLARGTRGSRMELVGGTEEQRPQDIKAYALDDQHQADLAGIATHMERTCAELHEVTPVGQCLLNVLHDGRDATLIHDLFLLDVGRRFPGVYGVDGAAYHDDPHHPEEVVGGTLIDIDPRFGQSDGQGLGYLALPGSCTRGHEHRLAVVALVRRLERHGVPRLDHDERGAVDERTFGAVVEFLDHVIGCEHAGAEQQGRCEEDRADADLHGSLLGLG